MITPFNIPQWSQRNPAWAKQRLGVVNGTTIGGQGCLITSIAMMNAGFTESILTHPAAVDDLFTNRGGYANGNLVLWNSISRLLPQCGLMRQAFCTNTPAPVADIKHHLDITGLCILQVGFGGIAANMHYVLAVGYDGDNIIFNDPWYGDQSSFASRRYGTGNSAADILAVHFFGDSVPNFKAEVPVAPRPIEIPPAIVEPTPAPPVEAPIPTPVPETPVEPPVPVVIPVEEVKPTPEWVTTWREESVHSRRVSMPQGTDVIDMETGKVLYHLEEGTEIKEIVGYFTYQNTEWARTKYSLDNNKWNGVHASDLTSKEISIPVRITELTDKVVADIASIPTEIKDPILTKFVSFLREVLAILISPILKRVSKKEKEDGTV